MQEYICPRCMTKIAVKEGKRLPSLYCRNCMKTKQLTMLRLIRRTTNHALSLTMISEE